MQLIKLIGLFYCYRMFCKELSINYGIFSTSWVPREFAEWIVILWKAEVGHVYVCGWSGIRNKKISRSFFQVRLSNFWKLLVSNFLVLIGLSICMVITKSFSNAFFRDSKMQNLKMMGCQNFCLPLIYLDIEFHQNRWNPYGGQFFYIQKYDTIWQFWKC